MKKVAFITGASRGIGAATALYFAKCGYDVAVNYLKNKECAESVVTQIKALGKNAITLQGDISDKAKVKEMIYECNKCLGTISVLVNNAGIAEQKVFCDIEESDFKKMFSVNVDGVYNTIHEVLPQMIHEKRGSIVNVSSMWGVRGASCEVHYSAAKSAVIGLTKALSQELAPSNIRVNCVAPGLIDTDMNKNLTQEELEAVIEEIPLGKIGKAEDIAKAIYFLADDELSPFTTGAVLNVNGGMVI
ncbi:MAG: 3-oxoacyl-ACP reductase FabG, partial [Clostridia bacterium]|nr:3-oxoacyl-ACP reductase FabG [Clostridia bacterium]